MSTPYLLDNSAADAGGRFEALSNLYDAVTDRHLEALGVPLGGRCWEVGAGGPSMPGLLARRVGDSGQVVATDIDVTWSGAVGSSVEVRRHDVATEDPPGAGFDLVHARLVLVHVPGRNEALRHMVSALSPGGALLLEDFDVSLQPLACLDPRTPDEHRANRIRDGFRALLAQRGVDLAYGRTLPRLLRDAGLVDVAADAYFPVALPAASALEIANVNQVRDGLIAQGHATAAEVDAHLEAVRTGAIEVVTPPLISAWGRRTTED